MCGRYVSPDAAAIERAWHFGRTSSNPFPRRFNVAPTLTVPIIRRDSDSGGLELTEARWGFVPGWWKQPKPPQHCFNARSEEAATIPMWRYSYSRARCLIPAEGWYEWKAVERADTNTGEIRIAKQPHFIFRPDRRPVCFAGLMSNWYLDTESSILTCAIITRPAAPSVSGMHDRMPAIIPDEAFDRWLSLELHRAHDVAALLEQSETQFEHYPVTARLNSAKTDEESFIQPL